MNAWETLGTKVDCLRTSTALRKGGLDWSVERFPIQTTHRLPVPGHYAVVRDDVVLGVVGEVFRPTQNRDLSPLLVELAESLGARFAYAGMIEGGRRVFVTMQLPGHLQIADDRVDLLVALMASHDGSLARSLVVTPTHRDTGTLLNTGMFVQPVRRSMTDRILAERVFDYLEGWQTTMTRLAERPMTRNRFDKLVLGGFGAPQGAAKATGTRAAKRVEQLSDLYAEQPGKSTWHGLVAICDWADHHAPARGTNPEASRAHQAILYPRAKAKALEVMR